jgi:hypothetical protein
MRIDPATNAVDLTVNLGSSAYPYNYSDMTGATLIARPISAPGRLSATAVSSVPIGAR